jgi:hypothetical protein
MRMFMVLFESFPQFAWRRQVLPAVGLQSRTFVPGRESTAEHDAEVQADNRTFAPRAPFPARRTKFTGEPSTDAYGEENRDTIDDLVRS